MSCVCTNFTETGLNSRLNGLFAESGLIGMLETTDYEAIEVAFPYYGAIVDKFCGLDKSADITQVLTACDDNIN